MRVILVACLAAGATVWIGGDVRRAEAGCVCPDISNVRVGDLEVTGATVRAQTWTVSETGVELALDLSGVSSKTRFSVLAMGIPADELDEMRTLAGLNKEAGDDPLAKATAGSAELAGVVSKKSAGKFQDVRVEWKVGAAGTGDVSIQVKWQFPAAGADDLPVTKPRIAEFCIDPGTRRAMKKADGFHRVDVVLSTAMATNLTLRIDRERMPISLCAKGVKKRGKNRFEIVGRDKLEDRDGVLPILFSATI